jgi:hypothetical protein
MGDELPRNTARPVRTKEVTTLRKLPDVIGLEGDAELFHPFLVTLALKRDGMGQDKGKFEAFSDVEMWDAGVEELFYALFQVWKFA